MRKQNGVHKDAAAYGLGVLDNSGEFEEHLRGCEHCRQAVAEFTSVTSALERAVRQGYLPRGDSPTPRRRTCPIGSGRRPGMLLLLALCVAMAAIALGSASRSGWIACTAFIVSPAHVGSGHRAATGDRLLDLP